MCSLNVFVFVIVLVFVFVIVFFGQVMSPHPSDQMSQRSQVSGIALFMCSLNVFVFVIVFVFCICFCHCLFCQVISHHHFFLHLYL